MSEAKYPVVVIGAGPVGLAAAAHLLERGETPLILEAGTSVGASILSWGHVKLFTPWKYATDPASRALLEATGWQIPAPESYPTGRQLVEQYLQPLAAHPALSPYVRLGTKVVRVARYGFDKMKTPGRDQAPFLVVTRSQSGDESHVLASAVIDASGSYQTPNPLGGNGIPALGEEKLAHRLFYGMPDIQGVDRARYANKTVLVAGSGSSAFNVLLDLVQIIDTAPNTKVIWVIRRALTKRLFGGGEADELPARGALGQRVRELVERGIIQVASEFKVSEIQQAGDQLIVCGNDDVLGPVDEVIVTTGLRPDLSMLSELRLSLDPSVDSPMALASMIDPNIHSCGSVPPHGAEELKHPETNFFIAGSKSYGRAPTFLLLTGYEQVRSIAAAIAGDWDAAREVRLVLPQTGVCSTDRDEAIGVSCCGPAEVVAAPESSFVSLSSLSARAIPVSGGCCTPQRAEEALIPFQAVQSSSSSCCG
jgi:thioredoxin reductase